MCNTKYEAHIEFITKEVKELWKYSLICHMNWRITYFFYFFYFQEWKEELWSINHHHENTEDDDYQDVTEKLSAVYGEEWRQKSSEQLMDARYFRDIPEFLKSFKKIYSFETVRVKWCIIVKSVIRKKTRTVKSGIMWNITDVYFNYFQARNI